MKARIGIALMVVIGLAAVTNARAQAPTDTEMQILQELRALRGQLTAVQKTLADRGKAGEKTIDIEASSARMSFQRQGPDMEALDKLALPETSTDDQVRAYIRAIAKASIGQNSFSEQDPQVDMYAAVGPERMPLLLEALGGERGFGMGSYHILAAIKRLAEEEHREIILEHLADHPQLVDVVVRMGWEDDARETLVEVLASAPEYLPSEWVSAVADLRDPATYEDLKWYLVHGNNRYGTYEVIRELPGIELDDAVDKAWSQTDLHEWEERGVAKMALQYGHVNALEYLIDWLDGNPSDQWDVSKVRRLVSHHVEFRGSNKAVIEWVRANSAKLVFDQKRGKFHLPVEE